MDGKANNVVYTPAASLGALVSYVDNARDLMEDDNGTLMPLLDGEVLYINVTVSARYFLTVYWHEMIGILCCGNLAQTLIYC